MSLLPISKAILQILQSIHCVVNATRFRSLLWLSHWNNFHKKSLFWLMTVCSHWPVLRSWLIINTMVIEVLISARVSAFSTEREQYRCRIETNVQCLRRLAPRSWSNDRSSTWLFVTISQWCAVTLISCKYSYTNNGNLAFKIVWLPVLHQKPLGLGLLAQLPESCHEHQRQPFC